VSLKGVRPNTDREIAEIEHIDYSKHETIGRLNRALIELEQTGQDN